MALSRDVVVENISSFANQFNVAAGSPDGVLVLISSADATVTAITYGGESLVQVASVSPPATGELSTNSAVTAWLLASGAPSGTQQVSITGPSSNGVVALVITYNASTTGEIELVDDSGVSSASIATPTTTLSLGGRTCDCAEAWASGKDSLGSFGVLTDWTSVDAFDSGSICFGVDTYDVLGTSDVTAGLDYGGTADDCHLLAVAIAEVESAGGGSQSVSGSITPTGSLSRVTIKGVVGSVTPDGTVSTSTVFTQSVAGSITALGAVSKLIIKILAGSTTPAGSISKQTSVTRTGSVTPSGSINKTTSVTRVGSITLTGAVARAYTTLQSVAGSLTAAGSTLAEKLAPISPSAVGARIRGFVGRLMRRG